MTLQDKVNLSFFSESRTFIIITSREQANNFRDAWVGVTTGKISIQGNYDGADGNPIELHFDPEMIIGMQIMELNHF